jgi:hypothetical protein
MSFARCEYPLCRHTKTNGRRCQSPALATSAFCFHHQRARRRRSTTIPAGPGLSTHVLHPLRNAQSIQEALAMALSGIASGRLHPKVAGRMFHALQLASANLREDQ